jgi:hypothetical protein
MAFDPLQPVKVDLLAQWKSLVPTSVDRVSGSPDIVNQICVRFFRHYE